MLYVTTRNNIDAFTAQRALRENRGADGGRYLPFRMPRFSEEEIRGLKENTFGQTVAEMLNRLFGTKLSSWDVDFSIGRTPVRLLPLHHRIQSAEIWHNPDWSYERLVNNLLQQLCPEECIPGSWAKIAIRIAVLFGIFGELMRSGIESADVSVVSGDFSAPISAWYARQWGLPIGNIVCCCNENNAIWDLICHGQMRTDGISKETVIPEADVIVPEELERLIFECGGFEEVEDFLSACQKGRSYCPGDGTLSKMRKGLFVSVVSSKRIDVTIPGMYNTNRYLMAPHTALAYAGLLDYRAKTGRTGHAVVLSEKSPNHACSAIARSLGIPEDGVMAIL